MDAALEAMHTWKYALLRWRINNKHFSESLEQLASYNGADMYKYNMLYTFKINQDVLTPESYKKINSNKMVGYSCLSDLQVEAQHAHKHPRGDNLLYAVDRV